MDASEKQDLTAVLASIRDMVRAETQGNSPAEAPPKPRKKPLFLKRRIEPGTPPIPEPKPQPRKKPGRAVAKIFILRPHMRVDKPSEKPEILDDGARIPYDAPISTNDSFAIANPEIDSHMLREIVREVVREQLMGETGRQLIETLKKDVILSLSKER